MARKAKAGGATKAPTNRVAQAPRGPQRVYADQIKYQDIPDDDVMALQLDFRSEDVDFSILESALASVAEEKWEGMPNNRRDRRLERKFNSNRGIRRQAASRSYKRFLAEGGEEGNVQGFLEWLIANWESIFNIIKSIIGLFGGAMAPQNDGGEFNN